MIEAIAVAALSARMLAQSARRAGFDVIALDLFGDVDTRRAARHWSCIGTPVALAIDARSTARAFAALREVPACIGWVAGGGFERCPELLESAAAVVRLLGNATETMRALREPATFFAGLAACGIAHPEVAYALPPESEGWLSKDARGCGGWHIRHAHVPDGGDRGTSCSRYYQRVQRGVPMSALFLADGREARICGVSELIVEPHGDLPYVFHGSVGPVAPSDRVSKDVRDIVASLVRQWRLVGLNSVDFLLDGDAILVLEVNPRPSASMALYDGLAPRGLMRAHVDACRGESLASLPAQRDDPGRVRGHTTVFAPTTITLSRAIVDHLVEQGWVHDIPTPGTTVEPGAPLCSVSADEGSPAAVRARLAARGRELLRTVAATASASEAEAVR